MGELTNVHGTGLVLGQTGLLLRGASGAGKSVLALSLLDRWDDRGETALLVSDDRVDLRAEGASVVMQAPATIGGLIELRGRGIIRRPYIAQARLHLVIDLIDDFARMLEQDAFSSDLLGVTLARAPVPKAGVIGLGHQLLLVREAIAALEPADTIP